MYNPLHRETPSGSNRISVEDEFIEIANLNGTPAALACSPSSFRAAPSYPPR